MMMLVALNCAFLTSQYLLSNSTTGNVYGVVVSMHNYKSADPGLILAMDRRHSAHSAVCDAWTGRDGNISAAANPLEKFLWR